MARASSSCSSLMPGARPTKRPSADASGCRRSCSPKQASKHCIPSIAWSADAQWSATMPMNRSYHQPSDLPEIIPVFPLAGALLLPRGQMPINIFEPRYLAMVDDALRLTHRLIGMIQPDSAHAGSEARPNLFRVCCVGRITQFAESGDGRYLIQLTGIARFRVTEELVVPTPYRQCRLSYNHFIDDFTARKGEGAVDRPHLLRALRQFL